MQTVPISFAVDHRVYRRLEAMAASANVRPTEQARRLFEAAYAARIAQQREEVVDDAALDRQVRQVFLLADCEAEYVAETLGIPLERVTRIIAAWRRWAAPAPVVPQDETQQATSPAEPPAADAATAVAEAEKKPRQKGWTDEDRRVLREMWAAGDPVPAIAAALGRPATAVQQYAGTHRALCPARR